MSDYQYANSPALRQSVKKYILQNPFSISKTVLIPNKKQRSDEFINSNEKIEKSHINNKHSAIHSVEKTKYESRISQRKPHLFIHKPLNLDSTITPKHSSFSVIKRNKRRNTSKPAFLSNDEGTFYSKIKIISGEKNPIQHSKQRKEKLEQNYEEEISKNIEKNKQHLNNPEEYFSMFFNKILSKKNVRK